MAVIGFSGFDASVTFKQRELPQLSRCAHTIVQGLDSAAALVESGGILAAAAEERFCRQKGTGRFPFEAIRYCLASAGLSLQNIDALAHAFDYEPYREKFAHSEFTRRRFDEVYSREAQLRVLEQHFPGGDWNRKLVSVPHHLAHAASCFYPSEFDESLIVVADGMGERHSMTVAVGRGQTIEIIEQIPAAHSLGVLYGAVTLFLGFRFGRDEYKVMGLAPLGNPRRYFEPLRSLVPCRPHGQFSIPLLAANETLEEHETHGGVLRRLAEMFGPPRLPAPT